MLGAANLRGARMQDANLAGAMAADADFSGAWLPGANFTGADLRRARFDGDTVLLSAKLDDMTCLADVRWNGVPVATIEWQGVKQLGDEFLARLSGQGGKTEDALESYERAVRAYRLLAISTWYKISPAPTGIARAFDK